MLSTCGALAPGYAAAHSLVRPAGAVVSYLSADATSLNTLQARVSGNRIEFRDETVDGGMDPGNCTPGDVDAGGYIIQTFCPLGGVQRVRIDLGEREDTATVDLPVAATVLAGPGADRIASPRRRRGPDELSGGEGNDTLDGGAGDDVLSGDQGADDARRRPRARIASRPATARRTGDAAATGTTRSTPTRSTDVAERLRERDAPIVPSAGRAAAPTTAGRRSSPWARRRSSGSGARGRVRVYATSSERGSVSASGALEVGRPGAAR